MIDMNKKLISGLIVLIIAILAVAAFSMGDNSTSDKSNATEIAVAIDEEPEAGFDPLTGWGSAQSTEPLIQSRLFRIDGNLTFINDLATDYKVADDLKSVDVTLREDVKFTDDTPLTAEDVVFTYKKAKENGVIDLDSLEDVSAVDDSHVKFTLTRPDSTFIFKLAKLGIVPSDSYNNQTYGENPVGSGPYKLAQWDKGQQAIFEVNDNYYGEKPYYTKITSVFLEEDAAVAAAEKGDVDIVKLSIANANKTIDGMQKVTIPSIDIRGISLPVVPNNGSIAESGSPIGNDITSDAAIRNAINVGINRSEIVEGAYSGLGDPVYSCVPNYLPYSPNTEFEDGQVDQAKQILSDGGWKDSDGDGIVEKDGKKASFELDYISKDSLRQAITIQVAEQAKEFGIEITPVGKTWDEIETTSGYSTPYMVGLGSADPYMVYAKFNSNLSGTGFNNPGYYNNSEFESKVSTALSQDLNSSYNTWSDAFKQTQDENPIVWVASQQYLFFVKDGIDMSADTHTLYPHGGDVWGNVLDWKASS
ncbi:MAG: ABC transporter substrate-binding protein [Methanosphaera stadtmanae]|nr:ABC transporter substrate-binding protein [Methanosphaera stadtmanae]